MAVVRISLLLIAVAGAVLRPFRLPAWVAPSVCALALLALGGTTPDQARHALDALAEPIAFLLAAVPLAMLLDELGFFSALAGLMIKRRRGSGSFWILAALVTTVLNLDAAVVLLTPLYVGVARRSGRNPLTFAFQPVLLACLASSALPVSNLTNLIAASWTGAGTVAFVRHLALPSAAAIWVGWWRYRQVLDPDRLVDATEDAADGRGRGDERPSDDRAGSLRTGGIVVGLVLLGFLGGGSFGLKPWEVALGGDVVLMAIVRRFPWRQIPWATALVAGSLGILAAAAVAGIHLGHVIGGRTPGTMAETMGVTASAANLINNLPALLVSLPAVGHRPTNALWAVLLGVNMGPVLLVTGSLASLLWLDALGRLGVRVHSRDFTRVGFQVGLPAAAAGGAVLLAVRLISG